MFTVLVKQYFGLRKQSNRDSFHGLGTGSYPGGHPSSHSDSDCRMTINTNMNPFDFCQ